MPPAARLGDQHACPAHVGGPVVAGSATVKIGGQPAARVGDQSSCGGSRDTIVQGAPTVFIEGRPAARAGDRCAHSGVIVTGLPTVIIGNDGGGAGGGTAAGGAAKGADAAKDAASSSAAISGTPVQGKVVTALVSLARQLAGAGGAESPGLLQSIATALEVALARGDTAAVAAGISRLQQAMQQKGDKAAAGEADAAGAAGAATPELGWQSGPAAPQPPPREIAVVDGRISINGRFTGLHAISEFDLIELQAAGRTDTVVQRLVTASAAGRNCVRVFCMYANRRGRLSPWTTPGYWTAVDQVIKRLTAYGLVGEFVLLADCDRGADGSGGVMPGWTDRLSFTREAGTFFKGKPVIACGMYEPPAGESYERLADAMRGFRDASAGTVPFAVADAGAAAAPRDLADTGASIAAAHRADSPSDGRYRGWIDGIWRLTGGPGAAYPYYTQSMEFGAGAGRETDPEAAVAAAAVCAAGQQGFCYHHIAADDRATPGLDLCRMATMIPQSPDFLPFAAGDAGSPIVRVADQDFPGGAIRGCSNGTEVWAVGYAKKLPRAPRVEWRGLTPQVIWRGDRVILWRGSLT